MWWINWTSYFQIRRISRFNYVRSSQSQWFLKSLSFKNCITWCNTLTLWNTKGRVPKKTTKFKTYAKSLDPYLPCTLIWTEKSLDIFFILLPTYLLRKFGQIWKKVGTFIRPLDFLKIRGGSKCKICKIFTDPFIASVTTSSAHSHGIVDF